MATELYLLELSGHHATEYWQNNLYFVGENLSAGDVIHNARDLISNFRNNAENAYLNLLAQTVYLDRYVCRRQDVAGGIDIIEQMDFDALQGQVSGECSSQQLCPIVRLIPPMGTKSAGRFFLPGIAEGDCEANRPSVAWVSNLSALMTTLLTGMNDGAITWTIGIYSRKHVSFVKALDYDTSPIIGWQRRRQRPF